VWEGREIDEQDCRVLKRIGNDWESEELTIANEQCRIQTLRFRHQRGKRGLPKHVLGSDALEGLCFEQPYEE